MGKSSISSSSNNKIIKMQEMVLIKSSEETKNTDMYGNLYGCLEPYKTLSVAELKKDVVFDDKARVVLTSGKKRLIENIEGEWFSMSSYLIATEDTFCQLCGRKNTYIFYIKNRINGNELNVGSDCVTNFKTIDGLQTEISRASRHQRNLKKEIRRIEFEIMEGDDIGFLKQYENKFKDFPILLPYRQYTDIKKTLSDCNRIKTTYINSGGELKVIFTKFCELKEQLNNLYEKAMIHYEKAKNNPLICDKTVSEWIYNYSIPMWEKIQKDGGILTEETLKVIYEPNYISKKLKIIRAHMGSKDIEILNVDGITVKFSIKNSLYVHRITFSVTIKEFMKLLGCHCLTNEFYKFKKEHLPNIYITNNNSNFNAINNAIQIILKSSSYGLIIENNTSQIYWKKNQMQQKTEWRNNNNILKPVYKKISLEQLLLLMSKFLMMDELQIKEIKNALIRKIEMSGKWISQDEKDINSKLAAGAAGLQKQREFY